MNNGQKSLSINETFIIEAENDGTMSACTGFFTNALVSCTGNTQIILSTNIIEANSAFSATTFYGDGSNLTGISTQDTFVTGGTYNQNSGVATFTNNTGGTFSVTGFYTGATDVFVTAVTFTNNLLTLYRNDGVTFGATIDNFTSLNVNGPVSATTFYGDGSNLTGISTQDTFVTGGTYFDGVTTFTNNTGGTFTIEGPSNYNAGVILGAENWVDNGDGSIDLPEIKVALYDNPNNLELLKIYTVPSGTTGVGGIPALANNDTNYIIVEYNGGSPRYNVLDNDGTVTSSNVVLYMIIYRANNFVHTLEFGDMGAGLPNKLNTRLISTDRFARESGCALGLSGSTGIVTLSSGVVWNGPYRQVVTAVNSQDDIFFKSFHSGGTWVYNTTGNTINNDYYDNGTDLVLATAGKYLVNWYFRGQEVNDHLYELISYGEYDTIQLAEASPEPNLPELITSHAFLVGRIIVGVSATTGITQSAFNTVFQPSGAPVLHNDLAGIQGGIAGEYYHLDSNKYNNLALSNTNNNFSVGQSFNAGLTATTISATTYQNLPLDIRVTGATKSGTVATFRNNSGGTFTLTGLTDVFVTGGTHSLATGTTTFRNSTGGTFNVSGYFKPSDDIYVTSGVVDHGPSNSVNNSLTLTRSDLSTVNINDLVNISDTTKLDIDALIGAKRIIRGKTYKISGCDSSLYYNGSDSAGNPVYTTVYLMGLEGIKLSETGIGIFYTPKYSDFNIFINGSTYTVGDRVIWGGYVWVCTNTGTYNSVDIFTLDPVGFDVIYPFNKSDDLNTECYNTQYDDIIYDYENDRIIYRNEQDTNIVQTSYSNIQYWINNFSHNPIKVFQWGNVYDINNDRGVGNQRIINSYNENINFNGRYQVDFYFDNLSYQRNLLASSNNYQSNFILTNESYISDINLLDEAYQDRFNLNNGSYISSITIPANSFQSNITLDNVSYISSVDFIDSGSYQSQIDLKNDSRITNNIFNIGSYQYNVTLENSSFINSVTFEPNAYQRNIRLENGSYFDTISLGNSCFQFHLIFDNYSYQQNITLVNTTSIVSQEFFNFTNQSNQSTVAVEDAVQQNFNFNSGSQYNFSTTRNQIDINIENGSQTNVTSNQSNITIKGYDLDWGTYPSISPQTNLFFINDLPTETTSRLIGKKENRLVEVSDFYYDGSKWVVEGGFSATTISATTISTNTISATTYNGYTPLPTQAASSTGVVLSFITDTVYGTLATPETGTTISANTVNGQLGVTNIVIHSGGTEPTFSSEYKKLSGSRNYTTGQINYIFATYITSTEIIYTINQRT